VIDKARPHPDRSADMDEGRDPSTLIARQPILNREGRRAGYELLYRGDRLGECDADTAATARVLVEALGSIGASEISGSSSLFVNFGSALLNETALFSMLSPDDVIIEVLESAEPSSQLLVSIAALKAKGFRVALDDFIYTPKLEPLLDLADFVKIDVLACKDVLEQAVAQLLPRRIPLLAEKVETRVDFERCMALGFELVQGYYFCRPETLNRRPLLVNQAMVLNLVSAIQNPDNEIADLAGVVERDVALAYQILKLANSPMYRRRRSMANVQDAMVVLGYDVVKNWSTLLMLSRLATGKPSELLRIALVRAHMCASTTTAGASRSSLFTTGLLSILDALLDRPMELIIPELSLDSDVTAALLGNTLSPLGQVLGKVQAFEQGDWNRAVGSPGVDILRAAYLDAVVSADKILSTVLA
jgi:EAL and modified HD-GYP domain-containing signal transduction protein